MAATKPDLFCNRERRSQAAKFICLHDETTEIFESRAHVFLPDEAINFRLAFITHHRCSARVTTLAQPWLIE
jgi:hypothetical protein